MSKKVIILKFCLVCTIILGNNENVLVLKIKFLIVRFIVLLILCLISRMLSISVLTEPINLVNIETFGLLCYIFHTEFMVRLRVFGVLCCYNLSLYRTIYSN
jgi:hypothetical protein